MATMRQISQWAATEMQANTAMEAESDMEASAGLRSSTTLTLIGTVATGAAALIHRLDPKAIPNTAVLHHPAPLPRDQTTSQLARHANTDSAGQSSTLGTACIRIWRDSTLGSGLMTYPGLEEILGVSRARNAGQRQWESDWPQSPV
ncbi:hypothetical protein CONLIGDRAFT_649049 [Coniochaeta ligniaria NRRL 30616]|uniref:Uncharacterized protein n=1 Tax=Coniochaeta ligniaria NRRL 30616 TaxID=1408157 RepID=A0A1J7IAH2_9PEZI|nr:hypothetical protein CONLIGDRAFT_649049 [Coniochaeta ligniaria NRRL 30616]